MNTNRNKLALRAHSIRILNADELRVARGGEGNGTGNGGGTCTHSHRTVSTQRTQGTTVTHKFA